MNGVHQFGYRRNRSNIDQLFYIRQMVEKKWEYKEAVHRILINIKKAYDSVRSEVLYNILMKIGIPKNLLSLIKMYLLETYNSLRWQEPI